jgi:hypothetical protein
MTTKTALALSIPNGERRVTKAKQRVIVKCGVDGGKVRFYFEDEGPQEFHQQMNVSRWVRYPLAPDTQQKAEDSMIPEDSMIQEIVAMIEAGDLDEHLNELLNATYARKKASAESVNFQIGQKIRVTRVNPKYLIGMEATIHKVNRTTVRVMVPDEPRYRKYRGKDVGFPKTSIELI